MRLNMRIKNSGLLGVLVIAASSISPIQAAVVVFGNIPSPGQTGYDTSYYSHGFEAQGTAELGNVVGLAGTARKLDTVTITMVTYAKASEWSSMYANNNAGWYHSIMLTVYKADASEILATQTISALIPWSQPALGQTGMAFNVGFDFSSENITLPNSVLVSVAYNTQHNGFNPLGTVGPYNKLNYGTFDDSPIVGTDVDPTQVMRVTTANPDSILFETSGGWVDRAPMMKITATEASPVTSFAEQFGLTGSDADPDADPDGDGYSNRFEYAFGLNPSSSSGQIQPLEVSTQTTTVGGNPVTTANATFYQRSGVTYTVRGSPDLSSGFPVVITPTPSANQVGVPSGYTRYEAVYDSGTERAFLKVDASVQ